MLQGLANFVSPLRYLSLASSMAVHRTTFGRTMQVVVHNISQGAGGEQGDPMMPLLFSLGQYAAFMAVQ